MNLIHRTVDSLDRPNAPTTTGPPAAAPAPTWLWLLAIIAACGVAGALLVLIWPFADALRREFDAALTEHGGLIRITLAVAVVVSAILVLLRLFWWATGGAWMRLENAQPIHRQDLRDHVSPQAVALLGRHYDVAEADAGNPTKSAITYGPHTSYAYRYDGRGDAAPELPAPDAAPLALPSRGLRELVAAGDVGGTGRTLFVGHSLADGAPIKIDMDGTGFIGLGGKSGQGKSNTGLLLLTQAAYAGWAVYACDLHYHKRESMLRRAEPVSGLLARQATTPAEIIEAIRTVDRIGRNRLEGKVPADTTVLLVIDEFTHLVISGQLPREVLDLLPAMAIAYRGVRVHGLLIGHDYGAKSLGQNFGRVLRGALTTAIAHRMTPDAAEFLLPAGYAKLAEGLSTGRALVFNDSTEEPTACAIPFLREEDVTWAARGQPPRPYAPRVLPAPAPTPAAPLPPTVQLVPPTVAEQVLGLLAANPGSEFDGPTIARRLGLASQDVYPVLAKLVKDKQLDRRGNARNYLYRSKR